MKTKILNLALSALLFSSFYSCTARPEQSAVKVIELASHISDSPCNHLSDALEITSVIHPEFTDSTIITFPQKIAVENGKLIVRDRKSNRYLMAFDIPTGKALSDLNRSGEGPEEYTYIMGWGLSSDNRWVVLDFNQNIIQYTFDGTFIKRNVNDTISSLFHLPPDKWVARTSPDASALDAVIFDSDLEKTVTVPSGKIWSEIERQNKFDNNIFDFINNSKYCLLINDTINQLDENTLALNPLIVFNTAKYRFPEFESPEQWKNVNTHLEDYILIRFQPVFNDRFMFVCYNHGGDMYFDAYNMKTNELLFRGLANEQHQVFGMPVSLPEGEVHGWPVYVQDDKFYFIVPDFEAQGLSDTDEVNPPIIEIRIK